MPANTSLNKFPPPSGLGNPYNHMVDESPTKDYHWFGQQRQQPDPADYYRDPDLFGPPILPNQQTAAKNQKNVKGGKKSTAKPTSSKDSRKSGMPSEIKPRFGNTRISNSGKRPGDKSNDKDNKTDKEKSEDNQDESPKEEEERKFEASSHADVDLGEFDFV